MPVKWKEGFFTISVNQYRRLLKKTRLVLKIPLALALKPLPTLPFKKGEVKLAYHS